MVDFPNQIFTGQSLAISMQGILDIMTKPIRAFVASYSESVNKISITCADNKHEFIILNKYDIRTKMDGTWTGPEYDPEAPRDFNSNVLKITENNFKAPTHTDNSPFISNAIDLQTIKKYLFRFAQSGLLHYHRT